MEFKSFMEALKGKQHNIDKNKNGQIDSHDFKLLRKEETEQLEEATVKTQKYEGGKVMTVHHGASHSYPLHPEHQEAIRNLKHGEKTSFKDETGAKVNVHRDVQDVHFTSNKTSTKTTVPYSHFSEETEELDEIHRMKTKLNTLDDISNKSVARQKLSNLMKSGKAKGALIANKRRTLNMGEEVEIDEGAFSSGALKATEKFKKEADKIPSTGTIRAKDEKGTYTAKTVNHKEVSRVYETTEEVEQIEEAKPGLYANIHAKKKRIEAGSGERMRKPGSEGAPSASDFKDAAKTANEEFESLEERNKQNAMMRKTMDASRGARYKLNNPVPDADPKHKTARDHNVAIGRALRSEDKMTTTKDKSGKLISFKYEGDWKKSTENKQGSGKAANLAGQAMQKMAKANEQAPVAPVPDRKYIKGTPENKALKDSRKPINGMPTNKIKEEKDEQEYGYEGDMALNQLATLTRCAEMIKEILKPDTDMPEWVQSKITLATDYIQTAADYMHSEMNEAKSVEVKVNAAGDAAHEEKWEAVKKVKKPVKESFDDEGNLISNKVSYKEFMLEYTPGPGGVTQIKGRSYGASYTDPEGADDYDDKKPIKPAAEKRGRGRPAGAKSGARKITGTSKLMNK
jgi:hypothetical protein